MSWKTGILLCALPLLAGVAGASSTPGGVDIWRSIETDMRQVGCFSPPVATVREALRSTDTLCRFRAVRVLGLQGDKTAIPDLKALHEGDPDPGVRSQAAVELVRLGEHAYLEDARKAMEQSPSLSGKVSLAGQLAGVGDASGYRYVEEACRSSALPDRQSCVSVLGLFRNAASRDERLRESVVNQMLTLAEDSEAGVRQSAIYNLATYGREMALPLQAVARLEGLAMASPDPKVQRMARTVVEDQKKRRDSRKGEP